MRSFRLFVLLIASVSGVNNTTNGTNATPTPAPTYAPTSNYTEVNQTVFPPLPVISDDCTIHLETNFIELNETVHVTEYHDYSNGAGVLRRDEERLESHTVEIYNYTSGLKYTILNGDHCAESAIMTSSDSNLAPDSNGHMKHVRDLFEATTFFGYNLNFTGHGMSTARNMPAEKWYSGNISLCRPDP